MAAISESLSIIYISLSKSHSCIIYAERKFLLFYSKLVFNRKYMKMISYTLQRKIGAMKFTVLPGVCMPCILLRAVKWSRLSLHREFFLTLKIFI